MKLAITIKYTNGEEVTYNAGLPEWAKWERKTGKSIYSMKDISAYQQADFLDLAYFAYKRDAAGKPTKSQEVWELSVEEMTIGDDSPKVSKPEASTD
jgi:hypothetical protein